MGLEEEFSKIQEDIRELKEKPYYEERGGLYIMVFITMMASLFDGCNCQRYIKNGDDGIERKVDGIEKKVDYLIDNMVNHINSHGR